MTAATDAAQHPDKAFASLQARAALAGFELVRLADETFLIARAGLRSKPLSDLVAVENFLRLVGAVR